MNWWKNILIWKSLLISLSATVSVKIIKYKLCKQKYILFILIVIFFYHIFYYIFSYIIFFIYLFIFVCIFSIVFEFFSASYYFEEEFKNEVKPIYMHKLQNQEKCIIKFIAWQPIWHYLMAKKKVIEPHDMPKKLHWCRWLSHGHSFSILVSFSM